jgi:hypothetical protein
VIGHPWAGSGCACFGSRKTAPKAAASDERFRFAVDVVIDGVLAQAAAR